MYQLQTPTHRYQHCATLCKIGEDHPVHNARGFDVAKFMPLHDHFLEGFFFVEDSQFTLSQEVR
jgi:hypothetical protein